jgi:hypothetical protein
MMKHYLIEKSVVYAVAAENIQQAMEKLDAQGPEEKTVYDETFRGIEPNYNEPGYKQEDHAEEMRKFYGQQDTPLL